MEISADYADFGLRPCLPIELRNSGWPDARFDLNASHRSRRRNLRNLRIFTFCIHQSADLMSCFNSLRLG
jgi:hypothetical protein